MEYALYTATVLGAGALLLMMPTAQSHGGVRKLGALLGAVTLGGLWLGLGRFLPERLGLSIAAFGYQYVFSGLAIIAAVRVITHTKPVYSALWFVMVVLSSAGLFLTLEAEFMAIAMVIIYGGAILVTYMFVIMLAAAAGDSENPEASPNYDRVAREPFAAVVVGFLLLAVLLSVVFKPMQPNAAAKAPSDAEVIATILPDRPAARLAAELGESPALPTDRLDNIEQVGLDLFRGHPLGIELAGVILLVSLIGAVVIAKQRVEAEGA